ncbi:MAG: glycoside hydrolase family 2 TIM barrel-domain containing protein [Desulfobacterales bacterium]|nr:glycoside hydrolase family 2 TIM barrel-domain containing protein [Desulfobacterales bacterium]
MAVKMDKILGEVREKDELTAEEASSAQIVAHNQDANAHPDIRQLIANAGSGETVIKSIPVTRADSSGDGTYFFSWNTLGIDAMTILQLLSSGTVLSSAQVTWSSSGLTVAGIANASGYRLVYLIPTRVDSDDDPEPVVIDVTSVEITGNANITDSGMLVAVVLPVDATNPAVNWASDNTEVATVSDGTVFVHSDGSVTVTATSVSNPEISGSKVLTCAVTPVPVEIDDAAVSIAALNTGWQYAKPNSAYAECALPHSVNAADSATSNYYRGTVNYKCTVTLSSGKRYFLLLDGANQRGTVSLNGTQVGTAVNSYQPAVIDLTDAGAVNGSNEIQIALTNASDSSTIPYAADYDFYNGLDRGVRLIETGRLCFDPVLYGTRRCKVAADADTCTVIAEMKVLNLHSEAETCDIEAALYLADGTEAITTASVTRTIPANGGELITLATDAVSDCRLWNGRNAPNLYRVELKIKQDGVVKDTVIEKTGFRTFAVAKHTSADDGAGFLLNGTAYRLYGTNYHTDKTGRASALTAEDYAADLALMESLKPTMIKFAHYPCDHSLLDYCDEHGIVAMLEIPWSRNFPPSSSAIAEAYRANITSAMLNMVKEYGNHPSVIFWCFDNELGMSSTLGYDTDELHTFMADLYAQVKAIDPRRLVGAGFYVNTSGERGWTDVCDIMLSTHYMGWYSGSVTGSLSDANTDNAEMAMPKAINEYGYGANPAQHVAWSAAASSKPASPNAYDSPHYEEYQAWALEQYLYQFENIQWPVFNLQWAMFDFAVASRSEGGTTALNTKGLVSRDRTILKDSYYLYRAYWNAEPMVHICQKRWTDRGDATEAALHVYSNAVKLELYHNGTLAQTLNAANGTLNVCWDFNAVEFTDGENLFEVRAYAVADDPASAISDSWTYTKAASDVPVVTLSGDDAIVNSGRLYASVAPAEVSQDVTWSSSDTDAAAIDASGNVTVLADGDVTFTATSAADGSAAGTKEVKCRKLTEADDAFKALLASKSTATGLGMGDIGVKQGVTVTSNGDGTVTLNGTATAPGNQATKFSFWRSDSPYNRGCFPYAGIEGDLLVWCEYVSGSVTGWTQSGNHYWRIGFADDLGNDLTESYLAPLGSPDDWNLGGRAIMARCLTGTEGLGAVRFAVNFNEGAVFDNLIYRIRTAKIPSGTVYNAGILTNVPALNSGYCTSDNKAMAVRNIDGTFVVQSFNPNTIYMLTGAKNGFVRLWDSFDIGLKHTTGSINVAEAGSTVKLSVDLLHIPEIITLSADSELRWILRGADGTVVAALDYVVKGTSAISDTFATGHAEVTATATTGVLGMELLISNLAFAAHENNYDNTKHLRFAVKVETV